MTLDKDTIAVLRPVVEYARSELSDMEPDDVPVGLRKATKSSARTLPPPIARSVVRELIDSERFRSAVRDRFDSGGTTDADLAAFLDDPQIGLERIASRVDASNDRKAENDLATANRKIVLLTGQLEEAKARMRAARADHLDALGAARNSVSEGHQRAEARNTELRKVVSAQTSEIDDLNRQMRDLRDELAEMQDRLESATERARRRAASSGQPGRGARSDASPSDPLEFARWLDVAERNARPFRNRSVPDKSVDVPDPLRVPAGISPDSASMLSSLVEQSPTRFIIDGYNVAGEIYGEQFATRDARDDVVRRAGRLMLSTEVDVLVVFDGPDEDGRDGFQSSAGVSIRFSRGEKADDMIVELIHGAPSRTVVVTNDRELRDRCAIDGCVPVWATAFVEWS
jgi:uncharacterized coiled-coil protein SlyX